MSFSHSGAALSRSAGDRSRPATHRPEDPPSGRGAVNLYAVGCDRVSPGTGVQAAAVTSLGSLDPAFDDCPRGSFGVRFEGVRGCLPTPLVAGRQPTRWGHASHVPGTGLASGSAPQGSRAEARKIAGDGFAAMADRRFADRRRTAIGAIGDAVSEAATALRRAETGAETLGVIGGRSAPLPDRNVQRCVGWLSHLSVAQASPAVPPGNASPGTAGNSAHRGVASSSSAPAIASLIWRRGRGSRRFCARSRSALPQPPREPEIVDPGRSFDP